ncbi:MAG: hypothetical protein KBD01_11985 [Acidobacteria bacterium]|nr:hypothetical protein [Acidobacteriota bacterium]
MIHHGPQAQRLARWSVAALVLLFVAAAPPLPPTPAAVRGVLYARAFTLEVPFAYDWSAGRPEVREGLMLVLEADPALLRTRETQEPILYVGGHVAQRISRGEESGRVVVLVPARVDLASEPIWFGTPGLPEQVDAATVAVERHAALAAGIRPLGTTAATSAFDRGGAEARFATRQDLLLAMHDLVREYIVPSR